MNITRLELEVEADELTETMQSQLEDMLNGVYTEHEETYVDSDGTMHARSGASVMLDLEQVEYEFRTAVMVDMDTGDFEQPALCSMPKRQQYDGSYYRFSYNIPEEDTDLAHLSEMALLKDQHKLEVDRMQKTIDHFKDQIDVANRRLDAVEQLRHWFDTAASNMDRHWGEGREAQMVNLGEMGYLLNFIRWGADDQIEKAKVAIIEQWKQAQEADQTYHWSTPSRDKLRTDTTSAGK